MTLPYKMYYYYCMIVLLLLGACGRNNTAGGKSVQTVQVTEKKDGIKYINTVKLTSPEKKRMFSYNDDIVIAFENKDGIPADSAEYFVNGEKIASTGKNVQSYTYRLPEKKTGNTTVKVVAWYPENKQGTATTSVLVKPDKAPDKYAWQMVQVFPHDPKAYTQGLTFLDGYMYEGTGQYGESTLRKTDMASGKTLSVLGIDNQLFGEGITIYKDKIYQITWRSRKGFIYDLETFSLESTFTYPSEGWGITTAGEKLIMSDGSNKLYHIAPSTFNIIKEIEVYDNKGEVSQLNELEYIDGLVWANVWMSDRIVAIDPETGAVKGEADMKNLLSAADKARIDDRDDVLNGIAYNPEKGTFYLTGKRWPKMFEISLKK